MEGARTSSGAFEPALGGLSIRENQQTGQRTAFNVIAPGYTPNDFISETKAFDIVQDCDSDISSAVKLGFAQTAAGC